MTATRPTPSAIEGRFVRLEPLTEQSFGELREAIGHPEVFAGGYGGGPAGFREDEDGFFAWARQYFNSDWNIPFGIRLVGGEHDGLLVGTSTLGDFNEQLEHAHIGWTAYDPRVWGTQVNVEAKVLMLGLAFDSGFGRVKIQCDIRNERSKAAIAGIGATFEGIVRRDMPRADGTWRDTALFSVLVDEWPDVRTGLQTRLNGWRGSPVEFRDR
jgi:RimJ/RimL family protein N-acetyltransferase